MITEGVIVTEKKETKAERRERIRYDVVQPLFILGGLIGITVAADFGIRVDAKERSAREITELCFEVDRLECTEAKCDKLKQTCNEFWAGQAKDYPKVARKLSKGLERMNKGKQRTAKGIQMRMK